MSVVIVAEKPAVARDIARVLGVNGRGEGYLHGGGHIVTWAVGHLVALAEPHQVDVAWKSWRRETLPMLPRHWPLVVLDETKAQFRIVKKLLNDPTVESVVCATDAGREGELIFRFIYESAGCRKPVRRLWISSLTPDAIRAGFRALRDSRDYDSLASAARGRAQADWLVGMNLSRAYTLVHGDTLSVGRVQTPTLAMVVAREKEILGFVPERYCEVIATFAPIRSPSSPVPPGPDRYQGTWFRRHDGEALGEAARKGRRLPPDGVEAGRIVERVMRTGTGAIESIAEETKRLPPPILYDLTELQRHANRLFGFSAKKTLDTAQRLYETHKLISYPRTDSRHLSAAVAATLADVVRAVSAPYAAHLAAGTGERPLSTRFVDDAKVTDHHAIIPTATDPKAARLSTDEHRIHDLVCRRLLSAWHDDHLWAVTTIVTSVKSDGPEGAIVDLFHTLGSAIVQQGWKVLDIVVPRKTATSQKIGPGGATVEEEPRLPEGLARAQHQAVCDAAAMQKQTHPPRRHTDATLLTAMETAGRALDDKELSRAMRDCGLGTPATRAAIIETLLTRSYIVRDATYLRPTPKGLHLIDVVHPDVKSPAMTGEWESRLRQVERGEGQLDAFMRGIEEYVKSVVGLAFSMRPAAGEKERAVTQPALPPGSAPATHADTAPPAPPPVHQPTGDHPAPPPPESGDPLKEMLSRVFRFDRFRPYQEDVCRAAVAGSDILLVMPTGAGKSLCYQLPGLVRGGTTLVISPLIALMEDQVAKLRLVGARADRIHSGRDRPSQSVARDDYLAGRLDFLFVAPERLGLPGFLEMLTVKSPVLIAVDEAHCISHWGHDFRPEYRMLGQRLPQLRPAPIMALTATATPIVQSDIMSQLGLQSPKSFIHGFRRENIAIEVEEVPKPARAGVARALLQDRSRRPAILYAPTRRESDRIAAELAEDFSAAAYHAGMASAARDRVQAGFIGGSLEVVVATIAFGMGVDKPDIRSVIHLALPQTLEAYYQEIGRAGRDGLPSRAILMHSYADRRMNEFFRNRDYPESSTLRRVYDNLMDRPLPRDEIRRRSRVNEDAFDIALEKLWIHGGAIVGQDDTVSRGQEGWEASYEAQREHRTAQEEEMARYTKAHGCRMLRLVRHFGDQDDPGHECGLCDACAHSTCVIRTARGPTPDEVRAMAGILDFLRGVQSSPAGGLFRTVFADGALPRDRYDALISGLERSGAVTVDDEEFEKDGKVITYQRVRLTPKGHAATRASLESTRIFAAPETPERREKPSRRRAVATLPARKPKREEGRRAAEPHAALVEALREWRLRESHRRHTPAFRIMSDRTMIGIASSRPATEDELLAIHGVGPAFIRKHGPRVLEIVRSSGRNADAS